MSQAKKWLLPLALGLITALLLALALWPKPNPQRMVVVAARDLGAGQTLTVADLVVQQLPAASAPVDAIDDPATLAGQTLAVVRFAGEPITPRHLGLAVTLAPTERGLAVKVKADTGLAGILRPGMQVGVIATLAGQDQNDVYAKTVLEGLRVLYVAPDFVARPYAPATASATVNKPKAPGTTGALGLDSSAPATTTGNSGTVKEGVLVLAASTQAQPLRYELITDTVKTAAGLAGSVPLTPTVAVQPAKTLPVRWIVPVELLAALNRSESLTLVLLPSAAQAVTTTAGVHLTDLWPATQAVKP